MAALSLHCRFEMSLHCLLLAVVLLSASAWAKPEDWAPREEEHWASGMCTELTTAQHHYANFNLACHVRES
jgi:hypothetical protein